jgi:enterobactin synthetase component D
MPVLAGPTPSLRLRNRDTLREQLAKQLGPGIGFACRDVDGDPKELWPVEREVVVNAIPRRQREFAAGRAAARDAMAQLGLPPQAIPSAPDRSPVWPEGLVGSIAHDRNVCIAIAGRRDQVGALGIDIEEDLEIDTTLWRAICTPQELASISALPKSEQRRCVTRLFCAKEAYFKWQHPQTGQMLDFCDVQILFSSNQTGFSTVPALSENTSFPTCAREGRLLICGGMVLAWLIGPPTL